MALLRGMPEAGADLIEIGMPFNRPDGGWADHPGGAKRGLAAQAKVTGGQSINGGTEEAEGFVNPVARARRLSTPFRPELWQSWLMTPDSPDADAIRD